MTIRAWSCGVAILTLALLVHTLVPRYEWRAVPDRPFQMIRIDRWFGRAEAGRVTNSGQWMPLPPHD